MFSIVEDLQTIDNLIAKFYIKNTHTNNYLMYDAYQDYIENKKLFFQTTNSNLIFLLLNNGFYRLFYYINNENEVFFNQKAEIPIVMEILYRGLSQKPLSIISFWNKNGFNEHLTRNNMMLKTSANISNNSIFNNIEVKFAETKEECIYIKALFDQSLDKYTGDNLTLDEIVDYSNNKNIFCAYLGSEICGALQFHLKNNNVWLGHIVVDNDYRGKGIAKSLVEKYIELNKNKLNDYTIYQLWVIDKNTSAIKLYENFGFLNTNKYTVSLLMK